jgi:diguanylate cyclase (GGDEF)-like protein/PAS domain S-box-containing protein
VTANPYDIVPCGLIAADSDGVVLSVNETFARWTGTRASDLVGQRVVSLFDAGSRILYETRVTPILHLEGAVDAVSLAIERADGSVMPSLVNAVIAGDGTMHFAIMDTQERVDYERELLAARRAAEESELRVRILQTASGAFGSSSDEAQLADALARSVREAFAATSSAVLLLDADGALSLVAGTDPFEAAPPESRPQALAVAARSSMTVSTSYDARLFSPDLADAMDAARISSTSATPITTPDGIVGVLVTHFARERTIDAVYVEVQSALTQQAAEVLVRLRLQRQLEHIALHDRLTGLANRELFSFHLDRALASADQGFALLFVDLDGFKAVNDAYGHAVGDTVLQEASSRLVASVRATDLVGRFGGDEFVIVCAGLAGAALEEVAGRIRANVAAEYPIAPAARVSASIGIAVVHSSRLAEVRSADVLSIADHAMYDAKSLGKDQFVVRVV